jgi:hypothetical protein
MIVLVMVLCLALIGFSEKAIAGPVPISAQESAQLSELSGQGNLMALKAGGSFPNSPRSLAAKERLSLKELEGGSPNLSSLKTGGWARNSLGVGRGDRCLRPTFKSNRCLKI